MSASPLVLLPGMMLNEHLFSHQVGVLSRATDVSVADLSGADSIAGLAEQVLANAPPRFALAGLSMGGIVALEIWRRARARVTHLALLDTTPHSDHPDRSALRMEQIARVEAGELRGVMAGSMKPLYVAARHRSNAALMRCILDMAIALGPEVFRRQSLALRDRKDSVDLLGGIDCPVLVLCGREDQLCPVEFHAMMAQRIPRADLVVLAQCGHLSTLEEPAAVTGALAHWLERAA